MNTNLTPSLKAQFEAIIRDNFVGDANFTIGHVLFLMLQAYELDRWIDVKEPPETQENVLVKDENGRCKIGGYYPHLLLYPNEDGWSICGLKPFEIFKTVAWQPLT